MSRHQVSVLSMAHRKFQHLFSASRKALLRGFSLVELLVAISLLSIVLIGGFAIFNLLQENYLREAGTSNHVKTARSNADTLFINFHDNTGFHGDNVSVWPADDPDTADNETDFTLTNIWGNANWLDDNGSFQCRLTAVTSSDPSFSIDRDCYTDQGITTADLETALTATPMPSVVLVGGSHGCIVTAISDADPAVFTVADDNCLSDASGTDLASDAGGAGVILPRFIANGVGQASILKGLYFDHFGSNRDGAAIYFGIEDSFRGDDAVVYTVTGTSSDNFTSSWVNIHDFNSRNTLDLVNIRDIDTMHLVVESLDSDSTGAALSLSNTGSDSFTRRVFANRSDDNISAVLEDLHINAPSASNQVDIRFTLGGGNMVWSRDLRLRIE